MPKEIKDIKKFLYLAKETKQKKQSKESGGKQKRELPVEKKTLYIKEGKNNETKFKLRKSRYLYTFKTNDQEKANKLRQSLPNDLTKVEIKSKKISQKKKKH